jgi:hypothetical protein
MTGNGNGETQCVTDKEYSEWDAAQRLDGPVIEVKAPHSDQAKTKPTRPPLALVPDGAIYQVG